MIRLQPAVKLREYQEEAITSLYKWFSINKGNPCLVLPTGSGKSHIIAALCKDAVQTYPDTRILMLTHVKELIEQNAEKLREHWPNAPLGIYSAGLGRRDMDKITFAGVQSLKNKAPILGHIDLIIVDECHLINHKKTGVYRRLIDELKQINPKLRVIGLTATPYRMGHGLITDDPAIFDGLIEVTTIEALQALGFLAKLKSKITTKKIDTEGVHKRGGEFIEKELQEAVNTSDNNETIVNEVITLAEKYERKHWLFFCTGVKHSYAIRDLLREKGITAETITGDTPKVERKKILEDYKAGKIQALTNADVLTTGFDYPDIDLIAMLRPTCSPGLYVQMAGRGLRLKSHTDYCLVLDFAGVVEKHGPITDVNTPKKAGKGGGLAPCKICPKCDEILPCGIRICPNCGYDFPPPTEKELMLHDEDIQGSNVKELEIASWSWNKHVSTASGKEMLKIIYFGKNLNDIPIEEYLCVFHGGYVGWRAMETLKRIAAKADANIFQPTTEELLKELNSRKPPNVIYYKKNGKFKNVLLREWRKDDE